MLNTDITMDKMKMRRKTMNMVANYP